MLLIQRRRNESIVIGKNIKVHVLRVTQSGHVTLGVEAPREIRVVRKEIEQEPESK